MGLNFTIENFVVAEDNSLGARLERLRARSFWRWKRGRVRMRKAVRAFDAVLARTGLKLAGLRVSGGLAMMRESVKSLGHAVLLLALILRYAVARPLHSSEVEHPARGRHRKAAIILGLAVLALGLALLLPERERDVLRPDSIVSTAEARTPAAAPNPETTAPEMRQAPKLPCRRSSGRGSRCASRWRFIIWNHRNSQDWR